MHLLSFEQLEEILRDLGPPFSALSHQGRWQLHGEINCHFDSYGRSRKSRRAAAPYRRVEQCQQLARAMETAQEILGCLGFDLDLAIDRVRVHPRATRPPTREEVLEAGKDIELAMTLEECRKENCLFPSTQAREEADQIRTSVYTLAAAAQNIISYEGERKDSTRRHNYHRDILLVELAASYENNFRITVSACREGKWPNFLSQILSILEDKEISPDTAYEAWLTVKKRLPADLYYQILAPEKQSQNPLSNAD